MKKTNSNKLENQAVLAVLQSEQEAREGKVLQGDLRQLVKSNHPKESKE